MKLVFLVANQAWVVLFGDQTIDLDGKTLFMDKKEVIHALARKGLRVLQSGKIESVPA